MPSELIGNSYCFLTLRKTEAETTGLKFCMNEFGSFCPVSYWGILWENSFGNDVGDNGMCQG